MSMLQGYPFVDQNTTITSDGRPSENAQEDCVAASICSMCMYLNGIKQMDHDKYNPDKFKDAAYGEALRNSGTAAIRYVDYCKSLGIKLYSIDGDYPSLIKQAHDYLAKGLPVMFTQDDWIVDTSLPQYEGWTHVAVWYADSPGILTSMDPWGGFPRAKSDAVWANLMRFNQIWIAERISNVIIPTNWHDDGTTLTAPNGHKVVLGFRAKVLAGWDAQDVPLEEERQVAHVEEYYPSDAGAVQTFNFSRLCYTAARGVYKMGIGNELLGCEKALAACKATPGDATVQQELDAANQKLAQFKALALAS